MVTRQQNAFAPPEKHICLLFFPPKSIKLMFQWFCEGCPSPRVVTRPQHFSFAIISHLLHLPLASAGSGWWLTGGNLGVIAELGSTTTVSDVRSSNTMHLVFWLSTTREMETPVIYIWLLTRGKFGRASGHTVEAPCLDYAGNVAARYKYVNYC